MRKIDEKDLIMFDNLLTMINRKSVFRELSADECSAIHQARTWAKGFREELSQSLELSKTITSAKCIDPGLAQSQTPEKKRATKK